ncbi:hypothetical protein [Nitrolancea hollandica]|nr:hypothetical protein [Nitrolancea hollandica]
MSCPLCDGPVVELGLMGRSFAWYRCRNCGADVVDVSGSIEEGSGDDDE